MGRGGAEPLVYRQGEYSGRVYRELGPAKEEVYRKIKGSIPEKRKFYWEKGRLLFYTSKKNILISKIPKL
jgi:hypothetical protein